MGATPPPAKDDAVFNDAAQRQILPRCGILRVFLYEAVAISLPERFKRLLSQRNNQGDMEPAPNNASTVVGAQLDRADSHADSRLHTHQVYALLDVDKSQVLAYPSSGPVENPQWFGHSCWFDVSHFAELSVHLYLRNPLSPPNSGRIHDICLGIARFSPRINEYRNKQDKASHKEWLEVKHGTGKISVGFAFYENETKHLQMQDFEAMMQLGRRPRKLLPPKKVEKRDSMQLYALKEIRKSSIGSQAEATHAVEIAERSVLFKLKNPFLAPVKFVFQSPESLYLVSPFVRCKGLDELLRQEQCFNVDTTRLYAAEILCALEGLHDFGIIYGHLQPRNILVDYSGHISICDFGLCKLEPNDYVNDPFGEPYLAPEVSLGQAYTEAVDWWTLGILLAEMLTGSGPLWYDETDSNIELFYFPHLDVVPPLARDISVQLFNRDPEQRLGAKGIAEIKAHPFFDNIDWRKVFQREYEPLLKPNDSMWGVTNTIPQYRRVPSTSPEEFQILSDQITESVRGMFAGWPI